MNQPLTLGQKIKHFRKRAGMSQLDLEVSLGTSSGAISRIESDKVNPTKETLIKIIELLNIDFYNAADLFDIKVNKEINNIEIIHEYLEEINTEDQIYKLFTTKLAEIVGIKYSSIWRYVPERTSLQIKAFQIPKGVGKFVEKIINAKIGTIELSPSDPNMLDNIILQCILESKVTKSFDLYDFTRPLINRNIARILQKFFNMKSALHFPLIYKGEKQGAVGFIFETPYISDNEFHLIQTFVNMFSRGLYNIKIEESVSPINSKI